MRMKDVVRGELDDAIPANGGPLDAAGKWWFGGNPSCSGNLQMRTTESDFLTGTVSFQCQFKKCGNYNVQLWAIPAVVPTGGSTQQRSVTEALITWFVGGNQTTRRVSVGSGMSISGTAEAVSVVLYDRTPQSVPLLPPGPQYPVRAQVAIGTRGTTEQPPTLSGLQYVQLGSTPQDIPVPTDAGVISVNVGASPFAGHADLAAGAVVVRHLSNGACIKQYDYRLAVFEPIDPVVDTIEIANNTAGLINISVTWGIDG